MLPLPKTPSKVDDGIERVKQSLSTKWGIEFPIRDATPSKRDKSRVEEKILGLIQFLYFKDGALGYAIEQFENNAIHIVSQWQFKPHGEPDVLPSFAHSRSALKEDFLRKQRVLSTKAVTELTESLKCFLNSVADRVKAGEKFSTSFRVQDDPIATYEGSPTKSNIVQHHSESRQCLRSESEPGPAKSRVAPALHPSSDDYPDHEIAELLANAENLEDLPLIFPEAAHARKGGEPAKIDYNSSSEDTFETPPTTPPPPADSSFASFETRKRSRPDFMQAPLLRNVSRKTSAEETAQEASYQHGLNPAHPIVLSDRTSMTTKTKSFCDYPKQLAQNRSLEWVPAMLLGSLEKKASATSSVSSALSAGTSTNTSFSARSLATSFDSSVDGIDTAKSGYWEVPTLPPPWKFEVPEAKRDLANQYQNEACKVLTGNNRESPDHMDIDSETTLPNRSVLQARLLDLPVPVEPRTSLTNVGELLAARLRENSPFVQVPDGYPSVPFRQLYEIVRVAKTCNLDISNFLVCFQTTFASYDDLWSSLGSITKAHRAQIPERSSLAAWDRALSNFEGVALAGKLRFLDRPKGPCFEFQLSPLKLERSYRLARQFGGDRFCVIGIPGLGLKDLPSHLKNHHTCAREAIINWLVDTRHKLLGRTWRAFFTKDIKKNRARSDMKDGRYRIYLFAEDGVGFRDEKKSGEADPRFLDRPRTAVGDMIKWFMPFEANTTQPSLKFFARLTLGVSPTVPTVRFLPAEIFRADDARADKPGEWRLNQNRSDQKKTQRNPSESRAPVMNDGCARISRGAARAVADCLGLNYVPCVFQGRIGGAKGMWMIDALDESAPNGGRNYWIEITDSQLKFEGHALDDFNPEPARVTFEVNDKARKLTSASLKFQLLPILVDRGVSPKVFANLLDQDLTARMNELEVAMDSGLALRKWNQEINPTTEERARYGGIEMQGGLPSSTEETINWFTEHGFQPRTCRYLKDQLYKVIKDYCLRLEEKMNIGVGQSTNAFMIADPLAILEEDEIHLGFSSVFHDPTSGFDQSMLHNIDVLVARSPAHLPSDVQKVRAVFKPDLMMYRDVIIFSSRGSVPLASKLSGGDYDGDQAWVCWDPDIVQPFRNADIAPFPPLESYGIEKDSSVIADILSHDDYTDRFLRHAFNFNLQPDMLGICANYHASHCYHKKAMDSPQAISIAVLLGNLVDSAKGGFYFDEAKWGAYLKKIGLLRFIPKPAYMDRREAKPTDHLIDHLVFVVAKGVREKVLAEFHKRFSDVSPRDDDLFRIRNEEYEEAKSNIPLASVLKNLEAGLKEMKRFWSLHAKPEDPNENIRPARKPDAMTFRNLVERCRADFVSLKPTLDDCLSDEPSDRIKSWQHDHARGRSSYWDLLKASVAFYLYYQSTFIWHTAGIELGEIKATAHGRETYRAVVGDVFEAFKLDKRVVDRAMRREGAQKVEEELGDDDHDDFGYDGYLDE